MDRETLLRLREEKKEDSVGIVVFGVLVVVLLVLSSNVVFGEEKESVVVRVRYALPVKEGWRFLFVSDKPVEFDLLVDGVRYHVDLTGLSKSITVPGFPDGVWVDGVFHEFSSLMILEVSG